MTGQSSNSAEVRRQPSSVARHWLRALLRLLFAGLLLITGIAKLLDVTGFAAVVDNYVVLPAVLVLPSAWALAIAEIALALWLLVGRELALAAATLVLLHLLYLVWLTQALLRGLQLSNCGCFGVYWPRPLGWNSVLEDASLLLLAMLLWRLSYARPE